MKTLSAPHFSVLLVAVDKGLPKFQPQAIIFKRRK